jgi:hypothetical protein
MNRLRRVIDRAKHWLAEFFHVPPPVPAAPYDAIFEQLRVESERVVLEALAEFGA